MIIGALFTTAFAQPPDCVTWDTLAERPPWTESLAEPTVVAEFAAIFGVGQLMLRAESRRRSLAVTMVRDAFIAAGPAAGTRLFPRAVGRIDTPYLQCPLFPPVPPDPSRCPSSICRPGDTLSNRCGSGRGPGVRADGTVAVLLTFGNVAKRAADLDLRGKAVTLRVAVARYDRDDKLPPQPLLLTGDTWGPGLILGYPRDPATTSTCDWSAPGPWQELGRDLASLVGP